jgi:hypothetical protein
LLRAAEKGSAGSLIALVETLKELSLLTSHTCEEALVEKFMSIAVHNFSWNSWGRLASFRVLQLMLGNSFDDIVSQSLETLYEHVLDKLQALRQPSFFNTFTDVSIRLQSLRLYTQLLYFGSWMGRQGTSSISDISEHI